MSRKIDPDDLTDAQGVGDILRLSHRNSRSETERWALKQAANGRIRPARRVSQ